MSWQELAKEFGIGAVVLLVVIKGLSVVIQWLARIDRKISRLLERKRTSSGPPPLPPPDEADTDPARPRGRGWSLFPPPPAPDRNDDGQVP